jgi:hypothetical protein
MLGLEHHHMNTMVTNIGGPGRITTFWETDKKPGVCKTAAVTREYQFLLSNALHNHSLLFETNLFTTSREQTPETMLTRLEDEMVRLHWDIRKANDVHGRSSVRLTGKIGNKQDDLLIGLSMLLYWGRVIMMNPASIAK